jgi:hypothetical protein
MNDYKYVLYILYKIYGHGYHMQQLIFIEEVHQDLEHGFSISKEYNPIFKKKI